jgi:ABC-type glycerol-3-phosphate transport system substrate-binding protein
MQWSLCRLVLLAAVSAGLVGCGFGLQPTVTLVTDRPEMAAYVDTFNAQHSDVRVTIAYQESPSQAVLGGVSGDVVIGEWLSSPAVMDHLDALSDLVKPGKLDPSWYYRTLLNMGSRDNRPFLVPLSFSLPAVVFLSAEVQTGLQPMFMPLDTLSTLSASYNKTDKAGNLVSAGFSPRWNEEFLTDTALLFGARFRPGRGGLPAWDEAGLKKTVDVARSWMADVNGGAARDALFAQRTLVQPWYKLLTSHKTRFALAPFTDLFALPEEKRHDLDYRWLSQDGMVPVEDDVLFAGIFRSSRNKAEARTFLQWFCSLPTQQGLLTVNQSRRIGVFAVTNGFSALKSINEKDLLQEYPILLGHVPLESFLTFPEILPDNWLALRGTGDTDGVIWPWIIASASASPLDQPLKPLDKTLQDWLESQK